MSHLPSRWSRRLVTITAALAATASTGTAQRPADSAARADTLAEGARIEARFSSPREVVLMMSDGETLTLRGVRALVGRVLGVSEQQVIRLRVDGATTAPGIGLPKGYRGGTAFVISDESVTLGVPPPEAGAARRAGTPEWLLGALVPLAAIVLVLRYGL